MKPGERFVQTLLERCKIFFILNAVLQINVHRAWRLRVGVIVHLVNREGQNGWVSGEDGGGAVAMMNVQVHGQGASDRFFFLQAADGDGDVVNYAEALAMIGKSVMKASAYIHG